MLRGAATQNENAKPPPSMTSLRLCDRIHRLLIPNGICPPSSSSDPGLRQRRISANSCFGDQSVATDMPMARPWGFNLIVITLKSFVLNNHMTTPMAPSYFRDICQISGESRPKALRS